MVTHETLTDEVDETMKAIEDSIEGKNDRTHFVAVSEDHLVVGSMGIRTPDPRLIQYTTTEHPVEIVNAFVSQDIRRKGVGRALVLAIEAEARKRGDTELMLDSGPRYRFSGWQAWNKIFGPSVAIAQNYYGEGINAPVWRKLL